jgi:hypothetical protein
MAKVNRNIFVRGLRGAIGDQFVVHTTRFGKTLIANNAGFDDHRQIVERQKTHADAFRAATTYARFAEAQPVYIEMAMGTGSTAYHIALSDWFGTPRVLEINVDRWTGQIGQTIRVKARGNIMVARVRVIIRDTAENVLEAGLAVRSESGSPWWNYATQSFIKMTPFPIVEAIAQDLPGNSDAFVIN